MICARCDGHGIVGTGRMVGPCESAREVRCETCGGTGEDHRLCATCETAEATVIDSSGSPSCAACADEFEAWKQQQAARAAYGRRVAA